MAHGRQLSARGRPSLTVRRQSSWAVGPSGIVSRTSTGASLFGTGSQAIDNGLTHVRLRGELLGFLTSIAAALDGFDCGFGVCIVSENAFGIGVTAIPNPITDIGWDGWLYHKLFALKGAVTGTFDETLSAQVRIEIDSKAMRKFKATDLMVAVVDVTEVGTSQVDFSFQSRALDKIA